MADVFCTQDARLLRQAGATEEFLSRYLPVSRAILQVVRDESNDDVAIDRIFELGQTLPPLEEQEQAWAAVLLHPYEPEGGMLLSPWFKHLLAYDPQATLRQVTCPVLALQGDKDFQLDPAPNLQAIRQALTGGHNPHVICRELPGLNHMFQPAETGVPTEYLDLPESIACTVPEVIADWILGNT